jgi:methyl-accepting chemotaxis protein
MAAGDLSDSITVKRHDEIGTLAESFETMRQKLDESLKSIQNHNIELEQKVQKRARPLPPLACPWK